MTNFIIFGSIGLIAIIAIIFFASGYVKAPPDRAYIISGLQKDRRVLIGKAGVKIPFFERLDKLDLALIPVDVRTSNAVPTADYINVKVNSTVNVRIGKTPELLACAATHFLNMPGAKIGVIARETLEASVREIIGTMKLEDMVSNRQMFTNKVLETAVPDLAKMGLEIISFNVQDFVDGNGVIENLGVDNVVRIQKKAAISRAESEKEIAVARAKATQEANDAQAEAQEQIAERNAQLETKKAELKRTVDTQNAQAAAAQGIEAENQRKLKDIASTNADIARAEREAELKQREIELTEYELTASIRKQADAEKYAAEKSAEANLVLAQRKAEAKKYEQEREAEAEAFAKMRAAESEAQAAIQKAEAMKAEADAKKYAAFAEAEGIVAIGKAEAEAILKKAEAQKQMGEASVLEMYFKVLPEIVKNAAEPLNNVDKITLYGEGNSSKLVKDVMNSTNQVMEAMSDNGIDIKALLAGALGGKLVN